jgi:hypothetical protein
VSGYPALNIAHLIGRGENSKTLALHHQRPGLRLMVFRSLTRPLGIAMEQELYGAQIGFRKNETAFLAVDYVAALAGSRI